MNDNAQPAAATDSASKRIALTVAAAFFMETLDATIIVTALPAIGAGFGMGALDASLGVTVYLIAMAALVPAAGWCAGRFGARRVFALAVGTFTMASLACGLAPTFEVFVAARVLQGAAAAFMSPVGRLVVLRETPKHRLIEAIGTITWPGLIAPVIGPPLGGLIATHASWRWIFLLNVPLGLVGLWLIMRLFPRRTDVAPTRFDAVGFVLTAVALAALVEGLTRLGGSQPGSATTLGLLAVGAVAAAAAVHHARRTTAPLLDLRALAVPTYALATATAGFVSRIAINASPFLLPLMFQIGFGMNAFQAGSMLLVYMGGNLVMKSATTTVLRRFGFRNVLTVNGAICAATLFGCGLLSPGDPLPWVCVLLFVAGMARSMNFTAINTLAFADVPDESRAGASTLGTMLQQVSLALGVALGAMVLGASKALRGAPAVQLADFHHAWYVVGLLMAIATLMTLRLDRHAGMAVSRRP
ncbi:drug resistance transporter, EmrB/QacA subfamily [Variovorax sp. YR752]|uniref:MFS transporter n=1 Tax=Variovorax sp. YR752 TaxID=1884383 RepID=UPI000BCDCBD9|nr:MFS transporter [Variovorax sp. YR752]SOD30539.1 drug resistance transporter, EmrB/QacA subfamily [Variovorax sp. YR752]